MLLEVCGWVPILCNIVTLRYPTCCEQVFLKRPHAEGWRGPALHYRLLVCLFFVHNLLVQTNCPSWVLFNCKMKIVFVTII